MEVLDSGWDREDYISGLAARGSSEDRMRDRNRLDSSWLRIHSHHPPVAPFCGRARPSNLYIFKLEKYIVNVSSDLY
jgi:hypothetical protein